MAWHGMTFAASCALVPSLLSLDAKLEEVFGTSDLNSGKTLSLTEFLSCLHQHQVKQLLNKATSKNYKPGASGTGGSTGSTAAGVAATG